MVKDLQTALSEQGHEYQVKGKYLLLRCLNPDHEDKNPSFRVDSETGAGRCFSCGYTVNLFKYLGLTGFTSYVKLSRLKSKLKALVMNNNDAPFDGEMIPWTRPFRGISAATLKKFEAFYSDSTDVENRIFFPIKNISLRTVVYMGRHIHSDAQPKYYNTPRGVPLPIYPQIVPDRSKKYVVLVEGIFDMLNLYDKGLVNTACLFGVNTLDKDTATKLLPFKAQGISTIYLALDGDKAGREAMARIKPLIEEAGFNVDIIELDDDQDPSELSQEQVDYLVKELK